MVLYNVFYKVVFYNVVSYKVMWCPIRWCGVLCVIVYGGILKVISYKKMVSCKVVVTYKLEGPIIQCVLVSYKSEGSEMSSFSLSGN